MAYQFVGPNLGAAVVASTGTFSGAVSAASLSATGAVTGATGVFSTSSTSPMFISTAADQARAFGHATYTGSWMGFANNLLGLYVGSAIQYAFSTNTKTDYTGSTTFNLTQASGVGAMGFEGYVATTITCSGASSTYVLNIPAGSVLRQISYRVVTAITGVGITGFDFGDTGSVPCDGTAASATCFGANKSVALGTTGTLTDCLVNIPRAYRGAITFTATPKTAATFTGGVIRLVIRYETLTAPTA